MSPTIMSPTIFIVPGLWEGPGAYELLREVLHEQGFETFATCLKSTGHRAPGHPTMEDDIAHIRSDLERVVEEAGPAGVIAVMHSAGGFIGSSALKGLTTPKRQEDGKPGGVLKIVFIAAGIAPEGSSQFGGPFIVEQDDGSAVCKDSKTSLFHDLTPSEADRWQDKLQVQPTIEKWRAPVPYCGWRDVPTVYILCELDRLLPEDVQLKMASFAGSQVVRLAAGHMAQLSRTAEVAKIISEACVPASIRNEVENSS